MVESATFYRTSKIVFLILPLLSCMFDFSEVKNTVHMLNVFIMHFVDNVTSNFQQNLGPIIVPHYLKVGGDPDPDTAYLPKNQNSLLVQQQNDNIAPGALTGSPGKLCERHSIKIVEEPSNYGIGNSYQGAGYQPDNNIKQLKMRVTPSNFSGPDLFRRLIGKCFSKTDDNYKYEFCPFSNVTQHEQSLRWNPYSGVLGVYQEWEIVNNTFVAMVMREGEKCGSNFRTVKITFPCGKEHKIINVTEPSTCNYHMVFETPYVCHKHSMLVYPTLDKALQTEWGYLEGELARREITEKGYKKYLRRIFVKAGLCLSEEKKQTLSEEATQKELLAAKEESGQFDSLFECNEEYQKLKKEVEGLRALNDLKQTDHHTDYHDDHGMVGEDYVVGDLD